MEIIALTLSLISLFLVLRLRLILLRQQPKNSTKPPSIKHHRVASVVPRLERARTVRSDFNLPLTGRMGKLVPTRGGEQEYGKPRNG